MSVSVCVSVKLHLHVDVLGVVEGGRHRNNFAIVVFPDIGRPTVRKLPCGQQFQDVAFKMGPVLESGVHCKTMLFAF